MPTTTDWREPFPSFQITGLRNLSSDGGEPGGAESPYFSCRLWGGPGQEDWAIWSSEVEGNREEQGRSAHVHQPHKRASRKKPGSGHSRLARRPAAGLMKHLRRGTGASVTKMRWGSADVPGPPEQNNDIITISVTDQTVHKVTGEGGLEDTHREDFPRPWMAVTQRAGTHCFSSLS